jgi:hypothetical protein
MAEFHFQLASEGPIGASVHLGFEGQKRNVVVSFRRVGDNVLNPAEKRDLSLAKDRMKAKVIVELKPGKRCRPIAGRKVGRAAHP